MRGHPLENAHLSDAWLHAREHNGKLDLQHVNAEAVLYFGPLLAKMHTVTALDLGYNWLDTADIAQLAPQLAGMAALQTLVLHDNKIGDDGVMRLMAHLSSASGLRTLDLRENMLGAPGRVAGWAVHIAKMTDLRTLILGPNRAFSASDFLTHLAPQLARMRLKKLDLSGMGIDDDIIKGWAPHLATMTGLNTLRLAGDVGFTTAHAAHQDDGPTHAQPCRCRWCRGERIGWCSRNGASGNRHHYTGHTADA
jgi:hypothetical protein